MIYCFIYFYGYIEGAYDIKTSCEAKQADPSNQTLINACEAGKLGCKICIL